MHAKSKIHSATEAALGFILTPLIRINEFLAVSIQRLDLFWGGFGFVWGGLSPPKPNASYVPGYVGDFFHYFNKSTN